MSALAQPASTDRAHIKLRDITLAYDDFVVQRNLTFDINHEDIFIIMGGSGCGKSTLLKLLIGLKSPSAGDIEFDGIDLWKSSVEEQNFIKSRFGVLFQSGALWSSLTLAENVALPLEEYTGLTTKQINEVVSFKLSLVGLAGFGDYYPSEISGGMRKRAGLARAMALDPEVLFFDEPSAGLDPISSKRLDNLIVELRNSLKTTVVIVTHELASIFNIGNNSVFLDTETKTIIASGNPSKLRTDCPEKKVRDFLNRGGE